MSKRRAVFLDRDGTVIHDSGYLGDADSVRLLPGAAEALAALQRKGFAPVVVSNQSGIGRGIVTAEAADAVHDRFASLLAEAGVTLAAAYYCPHKPGDRCKCRKPSPGLLQRAARELDLDLPGSVMVGDKASDVEAGRRAGCLTVLLGTEKTDEADFIAHDWREVIDAILGRSRTA
jgi:D-glycero-D-manno-heptose 1,7-bisphosphate phosphatase